jgi:hypothetical protein
MADDDLISGAEAAKILGVSRQRLAELADLERVPRTRVGRSWVYRRGDVEAVERMPRGRPTGPTYGGKKGAE